MSAAPRPTRAPVDGRLARRAFGIGVGHRGSAVRTMELGVDLRIEDCRCPICRRDRHRGRPFSRTPTSLPATSRVNASAVAHTGRRSHLPRAPAPVLVYFPSRLRRRTAADLRTHHAACPSYRRTIAVSPRLLPPDPLEPRSARERHRPVVVKIPAGIVRDLPRMAVWVGEHTACSHPRRSSPARRVIVAPAFEAWAITASTSSDEATLWRRRRRR